MKLVFLFLALASGLFVRAAPTSSKSIFPKLELIGWSSDHAKLAKTGSEVVGRGLIAYNLNSNRAQNCIDHLQFIKGTLFNLDNPVLDNIVQIENIPKDTDRPQRAAYLVSRTNGFLVRSQIDKDHEYFAILLLLAAISMDVTITITPEQLKDAYNKGMQNFGDRLKSIESAIKDLQEISKRLEDEARRLKSNSHLHKARDAVESAISYLNVDSNLPAADVASNLLSILPEDNYLLAGARSVVESAINDLPNRSDLRKVGVVVGTPEDLAIALLYTNNAMKELESVDN